MAEAYVQMGRKQEAKNALYKAIDLNKEYAEAFYNLAGIYASEELMDKANEHLRQSLHYYQKQGKNQEARKLEKVFKGYFGLR